MSHTRLLSSMAIGRRKCRAGTPRRSGLKLAPHFQKCLADGDVIGSWLKELLVGEETRCQREGCKRRLIGDDLWSMTGTIVRVTYVVRTRTGRWLQDTLNIPWIFFAYSSYLGGIVPKCQCCCIQLLPTWLCRWFLSLKTSFFPRSTASHWPASSCNISDLLRK